MKELLFQKKYSHPISIALGFFDCVHIGHIEIINRVNHYAHKTNSQSTVSTFCNNPFEVLGLDTKLVLTYDERKQKLSNLGVDNILKMEFDNAFRNIDKIDFLNKLFSAFDIRYIVCGSDYKFGKNSSGDTKLLSEFCKQKNVIFEEVPLLFFEGNKFSSTIVRQALLRGDICLANHCLRLNYAIKGVVTNGNGIGKKIGFPTANLSIQKSKLIPLFGVYKTRVFLDNKYYPSVTNIGNRPTFFDDSQNIETHIIGYENNLYQKEINIEFLSRLRDIRQFENAELLSQQIKKDIVQAQK